MSERIHVTVEVDTDELRKWADKHADSGNHGVAHVLYKAASDGESLSEQVVRAAVETERERIAQAIERQKAIAEETRDIIETPLPKNNFDQQAWAYGDAARIARAGQTGGAA